MFFQYVSRKYRKLLLGLVLLAILVITLTILKQQNVHSDHTDKQYWMDNQHTVNPKFKGLRDKTLEIRKEIEHINETLHQNILTKIPNKLSFLPQTDFEMETSDEIERVLALNWDEFPPQYNVHAFYYPWYGNPKNDGKYFHWNHQFIPHWNKKKAEEWPTGQHIPPRDIGSNFYPLLGPYSSGDVHIIDAHMKMMRYARIGVLAVSWYPPGDADNEGNQPDALMPILLDRANKYQLKVALHIEPFKGRDDVTMRQQIEYIINKYGRHPGFYKTDFGGKKNLPLMYIYDSYLVNSTKWANIFQTHGMNSVRGTPLDGIFIGLVVEKKHKEELHTSGFDGMYTYFATNGFTYGSSWKNWGEMASYCGSRGMMFIPSVGPGYVDTEIRPWNNVNSRKRLDGQYYKESIMNALQVSPAIVSITSFNEWHEGTQIESALSKRKIDPRYLDYGPKGEHFYLTLTKELLSR